MTPTPPHISLPLSDAPQLPDWPTVASAHLPTEAAVDAFAVRLANLLQTGDTLLLSGSVGAGKTHIARALIRAWLDAPDEPIPSPTFTLIQTYSVENVEIWHADLYRLGDSGEIAELGLDEAYGQALCLVEWPDRLAPEWPRAAALLHLERQPDNSRTVHLLAHEGSALATRLAPGFSP